MKLNRLLFLVKDKAQDRFSSTYWTQYFRADVRPLKVYYQGHDVTKLLTFKSNLTNYSYLFLAESCLHFGLTANEVRQYFRIFQKIGKSKSARKKELSIDTSTSVSKAAESGSLPTPKKNITFVKSNTTLDVRRSTRLKEKERGKLLPSLCGSSTSLAEIDKMSDDEVPMRKKRKTESSAFSMQEVRKTVTTSRPDGTISSAVVEYRNVAYDYERDIRLANFDKDARNITAAFKYLCATFIPGLKIPEPMALLEMQLIHGGLGGDFISDFHSYLLKRRPQYCEIGGLVKPFEQMVACFGMISERQLIYRLPSALRYKIANHSLSMLLEDRDAE